MTVTVKDARTADEVLGEFENAIIIIVPFLASAPFFFFFGASYCACAFITRYCYPGRMHAKGKQRGKDGIRGHILYAIKIHRLGTGQYHRGRHALNLSKEL